MRKRKPIQTNFPDRQCRECAHHYDEHSPAIDGHMILCRCPFKYDGGRWCIFMTDTACDRFKPMINGKETRQIL